ncbi:hypothetical protein [Clostridium tetani]|uniref:hypothetical protein n=1 Tax=Clostridium tetani TaxID=1513 RepID=UPI00100BB29E|nr:hypothetical protein [Clostridium tetani]RXM59646.1 hypothetical protein DP138_12620 [Clostridium tetani]
MQLNLLKVEIRKHYIFLGICIIINLITSFFVLVDYDKYIHMCFQISTIIWTLVPIYIFIDLYKEFYIGNNILNNMIPTKTSNIFLLKLLVFSISIILIWSCSLIYELFTPQGIYHNRILISNKPIVCTIYFIIPRIVSAISGIIILGLAIALSKLISNKVLSKIIMIAILIIVHMGLYQIMKLNIIDQGRVFFSIGTTSQLAFKQYAGLLSLLVSATENVPDIAATIYWNNVTANILIAFIGFLIMDFIFKSKKYEVLGK